MSAIKRDLSARDPVLTQALNDPGYHLRCDELVRAAVHEGHPRGAQPTHDRVDGEVEIGRKLAAPQRETIDLALPQGRPAADRGGSLGIPQCMHRHARAIERLEHVRVHGIQVRDVVVDLGETILPRHPARADAALRGALAQVEPRQPLRRHQIAPPIVELAQLLQESRGELAISVTGEPHLPRAGWVPQREIACGALDGQVMLFQAQVTKTVTISCGSATNRTVLPRPSSTRATDSRSSARTRWALFTLSPNRHAPPAFRPVAL